MTRTSMDISIIIVNWNTRDLLYRCLQSIFLFTPLNNREANLTGFTQGIDYEVIVVDNFSNDGSVQMLNALTFQHNNLHVMLNQENLGFAKANNQGLSIALGKYVLFMNSDMELVENTPKLLFNFLQDQKDVNTCTCQLQYGSGHRQPNIKRDPTFWSQIWILYKLHHFIKPRFLKKYLAKDFEYSQEQEVRQIMGSFVFTQRDMMKKIGGWSEDYFFWWEDLDLCKRLRQTGEKIMYTPISRVIHYEGQSAAQQMSLAKQKRFNKGMLTYFKKYHNKFSWFMLKLATWDGLILAWLTQILRIKPKSQSKL